MKAPDLQYDGEVWISEGHNRFDKKWRGKKMLWSKLLECLGNPQRTSETFAEYTAANKHERDNIKDIGGFVGGTLEGGKRSAKTVKSRSLLTFDLDFAEEDFYEDYQLTADYASACYSTHSHSKSSPRFRLVIPLSRSVNPDEYEAVARMLATKIGMDYMDPSTFQPSRLMYWPSCSRDADFFFDYVDAQFLSPDDVLGEYDDWTDAMQWPIAKAEADVHRTGAAKQADPTTKKGIVGAFCRAYDVPAAIAEFLSDVYAPTDKEDRYTYKAGSTTAGLVIYEDGKFAYSNHGTDPAGGQLCNSFDLVRIHKYGAEDDNVSKDTPINRRPSYLKMVEFASDDANVREEAYKESHVDAGDFDDDGEESEDGTEKKEEKSREKSGKKEGKLYSPEKIVRHLETSAKGLILKSVANCATVFKLDKALAGISLNEMSCRITVNNEHPVPWDRGNDETWSDTDDAELYTYISTTYAEFPRKVVDDQKLITAKRHSFHPVKDYLGALPEWDGVPRVDSLLIDYLGAEDNVYVRQATSTLLIAAVQRIYEPACKMDSMLVIAGDPGIGKSTLISKLAGEWFTDSLSFEDMKDGKIAGEKVRGRWIVEIPEMKGLKKVEVESVKKFLSQQIDSYRPAYGRNRVDQKRQCVFFGTVNDLNGYLKDPTGNRRFWPINVSGKGKYKPWDMTEETRGQIWAEALERYETGERCGDLKGEALEIAKTEQRLAMEQDDREGLISEYLDTLLPENWYDMDLNARRDFLDPDGSKLAGDDTRGTKMRRYVSNMAIWCECLGRTRTSIQKRDSFELAEIMARLGWKKTGQQLRIDPLYGNQYMYKRPENEDKNDDEDVIPFS